MFVAPSPVTTPSTVDRVETGQELSSAQWLREMVWTAGNTRPRDLQREVGPSELGLACERQIAYRIAGTARSNIAVNPIPSLVGTAMHAMFGDTFAMPGGRYLVEQRVSYRGVSGTLDLYDRLTGIVWDWKFPKLRKVRKIQVDGPPRHYRWQLQTYAAGLQVQGERPKLLMLGFIPIDGDLPDIACWSYPIDRGEADDAVDRLDKIRADLERSGEPGAVAAQPSRLCPWCPYHRPQWTGDTNVACPGEVTS
jgi:hypothetical protein